jgi:hypothetical protein
MAAGDVMAASAPAPVETKVAAASATSIITGMITWALVSYVPSFHAGLPPALAVFLPWAISAVTATAAGYFAKHTSRIDDVMAEAMQMLAQSGINLTEPRQPPAV